MSDRRQRKITVRLSEKEMNILDNMSEKYNIEKSECIRRGLYLLAEKKNYDYMPLFCKISTIVNKVIDGDELDDSEIKELRKEFVAHGINFGKNCIR